MENGIEVVLLREEKQSRCITHARSPSPSPRRRRHVAQAAASCDFKFDIRNANRYLSNDADHDMNRRAEASDPPDTRHTAPLVDE